MRISKTAIAVSVLSLFAAAMVPATSMAAGGASGAAVKYAKQGQIGEVITNPYKIAPLTLFVQAAMHSQMSQYALFLSLMARRLSTTLIAAKS